MNKTIITGNEPAFTGPTKDGYSDGLSIRQLMEKDFMAAQLSNRPWWSRIISYDKMAARASFAASTMIDRWNKR